MGWKSLCSSIEPTFPERSAICCTRGITSCIILVGQYTWDTRPSWHASIAVILRPPINNSLACWEEKNVIITAKLYALLMFFIGLSFVTFKNLTCVFYMNFTTFYSSFRLGMCTQILNLLMCTQLKWLTSFKLVH